MDYNAQGIQYMQQGKYEEAVKCFHEAIEQQPNDPVGYINFGNVLAAVGEEEKAIRFFTRRLNSTKKPQPHITDSDRFITIASNSIAQKSNLSERFKQD